MIRHFCDVCNNVLDANNPDVINPRWVRKFADWEFELIQSYRGVSNTGNLCQVCLRKLIINAIDRGEQSERKAPALFENLSKVFSRAGKGEAE